MLKVTKRLYKGRVAVGFELFDGVKTFNWTNNAMASSLKSGTRVIGVKLSGDQFVGADGVKLADLPRKQMPDSSTQSVKASQPTRVIRLYHGNPNGAFQPYYGGGRDYHDYGNGLYCTEDLEAAKEWACQKEDISCSYVYAYDLNRDGLKFINFNKLEPVYWLSIIAQHRFSNRETRLQRQRREQFIRAFPISCAGYDVAVGRRADDKYFSFLSLFLSGAVTYEAVVAAMKLGDLGQQVVLLSEKAYVQNKSAGKLVISGESYSEYYRAYKKRDDSARESLAALQDMDGMTIDELIRKRGAK